MTFSRRVHGDDYYALAIAIDDVGKKAICPIVRVAGVCHVKRSQARCLLQIQHTDANIYAGPAMKAGGEKRRAGTLPALRVGSRCWKLSSKLRLKVLGFF
uniref:Uncharacterized protein n=1 Tax=Peronospora matthiolae TaxID=2874970 RepID=A0AAV1TPF9_9STRA